MKKLPNEVNMEMSLLSAMLWNNGEAIPKIADVLTEDDFYRPEHRILFRHIIQIWRDGDVPNLITLRASLLKTGDLQRIGVSFLLALGNLEFTNAYLDSYADKIKEAANLRRLIDFSEKLNADAFSTLIPVDKILTDTEQLIANIRKGGSVEPPQSLFNCLDFLSHHLLKEIDETKAYATRSCGFDNLDAIQVLAPGLYLIGGLPALGKTTFALQLLYQLTLNGEKCVYCSYEMSKLELFSKIITAEMFKRDPSTGLSSAQIQRGATSRLFSDVLAELTDNKLLANLDVLELRDENIDDVLRWIRQICFRSDKSPIVCLDYLQIVPHSQDSLKNGIDEIVRKLKIFQRDTNTTFIVISSFNRLNYLHPVALESFKESGNIEYSADVVWGLQLDCMNNLPQNISEARQLIDQAKREEPRKVILRCLKNRKGTNYDCFFNYYATHDYFDPRDAFTTTATSYNTAIREI